MSNKIKSTSNSIFKISTTQDLYFILVYRAPLVNLDIFNTHSKRTRSTFNLSANVGEMKECVDPRSIKTFVGQLDIKSIPWIKSGVASAFCVVIAYTLP